MDGGGGNLRKRLCPNCRRPAAVLVLRAGRGWACAVQCQCGEGELQSIVVDTRAEAERMLPVIRGVYECGGFVYD